MRNVTFDLSADSEMSQYRFGGYEGEHNETVLRVILPERMQIEGEGEYRLFFENAKHVEIFSAPLVPEEGALSLTLPQNLMLAPALKIHACVFRYDGADPVLIAKSAEMILSIKNPRCEKSEALTEEVPDAPGLVIEDEILAESKNPVKSSALYRAFAEKIGRDELVRLSGTGIRETRQADDGRAPSEKATAKKLEEYWKKTELSIVNTISENETNPVQSRRLFRAFETVNDSIATQRDRITQTQADLEALDSRLDRCRDAINSFSTDIDVLNDDLSKAEFEIESLRRDFDIYAGAVSTWSDVQKIVRLGKAQEKFSLGDRFQCRRGEDLLTWEVIGIDCDTPDESGLVHSMTLQLVSDSEVNVTFDGREALFGIEEGALLPGTYYFTVESGGSVAADIGESFSFTLPTALSANGQVVLTSASTVTLDQSTIKVYTDPMDETGYSLTLTKGATGTHLFDLTANIQSGEVTLTDPITGSDVTARYLVNAFPRTYFGNNSYTASFVRQYLLSDKANNYWKPQSVLDRRGRARRGQTEIFSGFQYQMDDDFLAVIGKASRRSVSPATDAEWNPGDYIVEFDDKFFLLSRSELTGSDGDGYEGNRYPYFANMEQTDRIHRDKDGTPLNWWTRTPYYADGYRGRYISSAGRLELRQVREEMRLYPACCII